MALTRKQFLLGAGALFSIACSDDSGRSTATLGASSTGEADDDTTESSSDVTTDTGTEDTGTSTEEESSTGTTDDTTESTDDTTESTDDTTESTDDTTEDTETDTETETGDPVCPQGASGTILQNHSHSLLIPQADVEAGQAMNYNIQGGANHGHTVSLTAADMAQLALGNPVEKESSVLVDHSHTVLIGCL